MGQALYRKYRSRSFESVVGQDHIIRTLQNAISKGRISHAYLFTGPRGVGKTSVARILAHAVNGLGYKDESSHLDIIEIDAASNRRIDEIRDLRDRVRIAPVAAKYKVYIIDEVHMLTREAFNALLKTLEEPPAHVIFILATTEAHKLPDTIISRTQRFEFKPVSAAQLAQHLADIAKQEKIKISAEALHLLAEFGNGSFRDSISYLDQLGSFDRDITQDDVRSILGLPPVSTIDELLRLITSGDSAAVLANLIQIEEQGVNPVSVASALSSRLRAKALRGQIDRSQIELLKELSKVSASGRPQEALEIALLSSVTTASPDIASVNQKQTATKAPLKQTPDPKPAPKDGDFNLSQWDEVLDRSKAEAASVYTALRLADPDYSDGVLLLKFQFPLHQKKLDQLKNQALVAKIIKEVSGTQVSIRTALLDKAAVAEEIQPVESDSVNAINSIFGTVEVLEA